MWGKEKMTTNIEIGKRIKARRLALGMSQEELANLLGYKSRSSINKIEVDGRGLPQSKIVSIAKALHTTPSYLMGWEDDAETVQAFDAVKFLQDAFEQTGYYKDRFTKEEIEDIMQYANFVLTKRAK